MKKFKNVENSNKQSIYNYFQRKSSFSFKINILKTTLGVNSVCECIHVYAYVCTNVYLYVCDAPKLKMI